jgi:PTS system nitrogen regulatory IIA component
MEKDILTLEEVAEYLRVSERTIYDWAKKGEIPAGKIGTVWRFKRREIEKWVNDRLAGQSEPSLQRVLELGDIISEKRIVFLDSVTKQETLEELIELISQAPQVASRYDLRDEIFRREELMSTGIGMGIAIPHVRIHSVNDLVGAIGICEKGIPDYQSLDNEPIRIVIMLAAGFDQHAKYLKALAHISARLKDPAVRESLFHAHDTGSVFHIIAG